MELRRLKNASLFFGPETFRSHPLFSFHQVVSEALVVEDAAAAAAAVCRNRLFGCFDSRREVENDTFRKWPTTDFFSSSSPTHAKMVEPTDKNKQGHKNDSCLILVTSTAKTVKLWVH